MFDQDVQQINEAYQQVSEGVVANTLLGLAGLVISTLGGYNVAKSIHHAADDYTTGMPSMAAPTAGASAKTIDTYLHRIAMVNVKLDPKHVEALNLIQQHGNDEQKRVAEHILDKQSNIR